MLMTRISVHGSCNGLGAFNILPNFTSITLMVLVLQSISGWISCYSMQRITTGSNEVKAELPPHAIVGRAETIPDGHYLWVRESRLQRQARASGTRRRQRLSKKQRNRNSQRSGSRRSLPARAHGKYDGDIDLRGHSIDEYVDAVIDDSPYAKREQGNTIQFSAVKNRYSLWLDGVVPYTISPGLDAGNRSIIMNAIAQFHTQSCIKWVPRIEQYDYVNFVFDNDGCYSTVGKYGGQQDLSIGPGCDGIDTVIHEMMHAIGFFHEHNRPDRDDYVLIMWDNVEPWARQYFNKLALSQVDTLGAKYDYRSIMHYDRWSYSRNGKDTIAPQTDTRLGNYIGFSPGDIEKINLLYECPKLTKSIKRKQVQQSDCVDKDHSCKTWAEGIECTRNPIYMANYCRKSCNLCENSPSHCLDDNRICNIWTADGQCKANPKYMKEFCNETCSQCLAMFE